VADAQNLSIEVLEEIRLLTNLETEEDKLLQIVPVATCKERVNTQVRVPFS
jgi:type II secretory pathway predicted ATPase ExeA